MKIRTRFQIDVAIAAMILTAALAVPSAAHAEYVIHQYLKPVR